MRILVVEDDPKLRQLLVRGLEDEGFGVDSASDGEDGLWRARGGGHDAIVLDLMLPRLSGLELLRALRAAGGTTPVLILTARDAPHEKVAGLDAGADDWLTKPFTFVELCARLRALVRRANRAATAVIRVADLEVDTAGRRVRRAGRDLSLRAREYALLELLALRRGRVVTRAQICGHVFGSDAEPPSNSVDVHVSRLRVAVDRGFGRALIHTVRGQGYVLDEPR